MAILSMIPDGSPDLITCLNELLRINKQQKTTFWFLSLENPGKTEDHALIQTRILTDLPELEESEKLNPWEDMESRT